LRIIKVLTSVVLIGVSIWCFAHQGSPFQTLAFIIGVGMLIQMFGGICAYIGVKREFTKSSWILVEAISTGMLGIIVLLDQITVDNMIPIVFGMWIMYSGMLRTIAACHMMIAKEKGWSFVLIFGILTAGFGVYCFFNGLLFNLNMILLISVVFLLQGINVMALAVNMPGKYKVYPKDMEKQIREKKHKKAAEKKELFEYHN